MFCKREGKNSLILGQTEGMNVMDHPRFLNPNEFLIWGVQWPTDHRIYPSKGGDSDYNLHTVPTQQNTARLVYGLERPDFTN